MGTAEYIHYYTHYTYMHKGRTQTLTRLLTLIDAIRTHNESFYTHPHPRVFFRQYTHTLPLYLFDRAFYPTQTSMRYSISGTIAFFLIVYDRQFNIIVHSVFNIHTHAHTLGFVRWITNKRSNNENNENDDDNLVFIYFVYVSVCRGTANDD